MCLRILCFRVGDESCFSLSSVLMGHNYRLGVLFSLISVY